MHVFTSTDHWFNWVMQEKYEVVQTIALAKDRAIILLCKKEGKPQVSQWRMIQEAPKQITFKQTEEFDVEYASGDDTGSGVAQPEEGA